MDDLNQSIDPSTNHKTCALESDSDVALCQQLYDAVYQDIEENSMNESLSQKHPNRQLVESSIEVEENIDLPQIVMDKGTIPAETAQLNTDENTIMNE